MTFPCVHMCPQFCTDDEMMQYVGKNLLRRIIDAFSGRQKLVDFDQLKHLGFKEALSLNSV